jgi:glutaredoxin
MTYTIYSKDGCPFCTKVQRVLELAEQKHVVLKLGRDYIREEFYEKFGQGSTFPQVVLNVEGPHDGTHLGGCTETVKYLKENNIV